MFDHFPPPTTTTIPLFGGLFVVVKNRLTVGEERRARRRLYYFDPEAGAMRVDPTMHGLATVLAYLVDWNVTRGGAVLDIRQLAIDAARDESKIADLQRIVEALDPVTYDAIEEAIRTHEETEDARRVAEKKSTDGSGNSTSSSPSVPDGPSSMSGLSVGTITTPSPDASALVGA